MKSAILQISSNFALVRSLSANQIREIAQNRNIDPRDSVVKDLTASRWSDTVTDLGAHVYGARGPGACGTCERVRKDRKALVSGTFC